MDIGEFTKMYVEERKSYKEIGERFGIGKSAIYRWIQKLKLPRRIDQVQDLAGQKFGDLEVVKYLKSGRYSGGGKYDLWECKCSCGAILNVRSGNLKHSGTSQCKCCSNIKSREKKEYPIDYNVWFRLKERCANKGIELGVTPQYLYDLFIAQNKICSLSGVEIYFGETREAETTASPDRIDPGKGYVEGNVRWVHKYVNSMRNNKTDEEFFYWCEKITKYQNKSI